MSDVLELKFNTPFEQAVNAANRRSVMLPSDYYGKIPAKMRSLAFTVSYIPKIEQINQILESLQEAQKSGISLKRWQKEIDYAQFGITKAHAETVFRNAMQTHYAVGHWESFQRTKKALPYLRYVAINDSRTSQCCRALSGIIRKVDDPFWQTHTPPNHHRCRSVLQALTESQAQKRSPEMVGLNQPESPDMEPQKGWNYNAALSHQAQMKDLALEKIAKLPPMLKSQAENILADKVTMIDKKAFADWIEMIAPREYKARHEYMLAGTFPDYVMTDADVMELKPINNEINISDHQLRHSLRPFKENEKNATVPIESIKQLPEKLESARWFYDKKHDNVLAVFDVELSEKIGKSAIAINFKKKKGRELVNAIVTSGIIKNEDFEAGIKNGTYRELKNTP